MAFLTANDLPKLVHFHGKWMPATVCAGVGIVVLCACFRQTRWIIPVWLLSVLATGAHTACVALLLCSGLTDFAGMAALYLAMLSWPVTATFIALLFARPRKRNAA